MTTFTAWNKRAIEIWFGGDPQEGGVLIGHLSSRTPRATRLPDSLKKWLVTTDTGPNLKRARWWSGFSYPHEAEAFLIGLWIATQQAAPADDAVDDDKDMVPDRADVWAATLARNGL